MNENRNKLKRYCVTYLNLQTGQREYYMNRSSFTLEEVKDEIRKLKEQQEQYADTGWGRTRANFQKKQIK